MNRKIKAVLCCAVCIFIWAQAMAQGTAIKGTVKDTKGEALPFITITEQGTDNGGTTNENGEFSFITSAARGTLVFTAVGYKTQRHAFNKGMAPLRVSMQQENYALEEVVVGGGKDPAYAIMEKAIALRRKHLTENQSYSCSVYTKGMQKVTSTPKKILGRPADKVMKVDTNKTPLAFLTEGLYDYYAAQPDTIKEKMLYSKVSGNANGIAFTKPSDFNINYYNNVVLRGPLMVRGLVSPLADNAMAFYKYRLLETEGSGNSEVYKIRVYPKNKYDPAFSGIIYITGNDYRLGSSKLTVTNDAGINLLDSLTIEQNLRQASGMYLPAVTNLQFKGGAFGFKFKGYYVAVYENYKRGNALKNMLKAGECYRIEDSATNLPDRFWKNNRPLPLTETETTLYAKADSLEQVRKSTAYRDSIQRVRNKPGLIGLFATGHYSFFRRDSTYMTFDPLLDAVFYNPVEGWGGKYGITIGKRLPYGNSVWVRPFGRYGFGYKKLSGMLSAGYTYDRKHFASIEAAGGVDIADLSDKPTQSIGLMGNSFNTLLYETNYVKLYEKKFGRISTSRELVNGLYATLNGEYSQNSTLHNTTNNKIRDVKDREFTSNNPFTPQYDVPLFQPYKAFTLGLTLRYVPGQTYSTYPSVKTVKEGKWPIITLAYEKGMPGVMGSSEDFDFGAITLSKEHIPMGLAGNLSFVLEAGGFLRNNVVYFPDYHHFRGNTSLLSLPDTKRFTFLDYYKYSTSNRYLEGHVEHSFGGYFLNKIGGLRKLKLEEIVGGAVLLQPDKPGYYEAYIGLQRFIFRVSYGVAMEGNHKFAQGFRISVGI